MAPIDKVHAHPKPSEVKSHASETNAQKPNETERLSQEEASHNRMDKHAAWTQFADDKAGVGQVPAGVKQHQLDVKKVEEGSDAARHEANRMREHLAGKV